MWTPPLWSPPVALNPAEEKVANRAATRKKLFVFLRESRSGPMRLSTWLPTKQLYLEC